MVLYITILKLAIILQDISQRLMLNKNPIPKKPKKPSFSYLNIRLATHFIHFNVSLTRKLYYSK